MNKIVIALCLFGLLAFGCVQPPPEQPPAAPEEEQEQPPVGGDRDEHGCIGSAGYTWCEPKQKCLREWEEPCEETPGHMTEERAREIAQASPCTENGSLTDEADYNDNTNTWWIGLDIQKEGCSPACVVEEATETAEINWRCTGLIPPGEPAGKTCTKEGTDHTMTLSDAVAVSLNSLCGANGVLVEESAVCNEITGTWWVDINMTTPKPGCNPACVINVETRLPEVNWRCTGLAG